MAPKLGPQFWKNFLSHTHTTEATLQATRIALQPQCEPESDAVRVQAKCRMYSVAAREALQQKGFQVASSRDARVMCTWCWTSRSGHSTSLKAHLTIWICAPCPESVKELYRDSVLDSSASSFLGANQRAMVEAAHVADDALVSLQESSPVRAPAPALAVPDSPGTVAQSRYQALPSSLHSQPSTSTSRCDMVVSDNTITATPPQHLLAIPPYPPPPAAPAAPANSDGGLASAMTTVIDMLEDVAEEHCPQKLPRRSGGR